MNTIDFLSIANAICPDRDVLVFEGKRWTYSQANERINRLGHALAKLGVEKGDRVAILQVNCSQSIELYFAVAKLGGIFVPLNFRAKIEELTYMLANAEAKILFVGDRYLDMVRSILPALPTITHCVCFENQQPGMTFYEDLLVSSADAEIFTDIGDEDTTILMYTAGTTGKPKCVPLRHDGFVNYVLNNVEPASPDIEEKNLITLPLYHVAGIHVMLTSVYSGRTLVLMRQFEVKEWLEIVQREKINRAMLVPTMLKIIIECPDFGEYDLSSLRVITYGAASMTFDVITKALQVMPWVKFFNAYGQTETTAVIAALGPEDHIIEGTEAEKEKKLKRLASSIGKPLPGVQIKIIDEQRKDLPPFEIGEIVAKGPGVMKGYWGDEEGATQVFTPNGWLATKDKGWMDEEGYIFLAGRADDLIIRGGENISPEEVEDVLHSHPKVEEAAVIGVPDPKWGQQPIALVVIKRGEIASDEEIIEYCRSRLASSKCPQSVVFVDSLPRNPMGKVMRKVLRERYGQL